MNKFLPINILLVPLGCTEVQYDPDAIKQSFFYKLFAETTFIYNTREKIYNLTHNIQVQRKQYGIRHYVVGTTNSAMGDTLPSVVTSLSMAGINY